MDAAHGFRRDVLVSIRPFYASRILVAAHTSTASSRSCSVPFQFGSLYDQGQKVLAKSWFYYEVTDNDGAGHVFSI